MCSLLHVDFIFFVDQNMLSEGALTMHQDANLSFSCPCVGSFLARHDDLELGATKDSSANS